MPHISDTQLQMHTRCQVQWARRYLNDERHPPGIALLVGSGYHVGAETNFRQKIDSWTDLPLPDVVDAAVEGFKNRMVEDSFVLSDDEKTVGASIIVGRAIDQTAIMAAAFRGAVAGDYQPTAVEVSVDIPLAGTEYTFATVSDLWDLAGRVVDFKTAARPDRHAADDSLQLTAYAAAYTRHHAGKAPSGVVLDRMIKTAVPTRELQTTTRTPAHFDILAARINVMLASIKTGIFTPAPVGSWWCSKRFCGYATTCPYYQGRPNNA